MGLPEQQVQPELILRGQLQELDLETLLSALRLGRQYLTLDVFDAVGVHTGSLAVKAGRVISAYAGDQTGTAAFRQLLESRDGSEFRVHLQPSDVDLDAEPLAETVEAARVQEVQFVEHTADPQPTRTRIIQGVLSDSLTLDEVLRVVAITRQHASVELTDPDGNVVGEVRAKAGKILSARAGELIELPALHALFSAPEGTAFVLFTDDQSVGQLQPLGSLTELIGLVRAGITEAPSTAANGFRKTLPPPLPAVRRNPEVAPQARILEGSLDEFELPHVLRVLSTSRQHFELHIRDDASQSVGVIDVKSGFIVAASTDQETGITAARALLGARTGRFVAIRRAQSASDDRPALISVSELLQPKAAGAEPLGDTQALSSSNESQPPAAAPIPVLDGKLGDLDVASLLRVAAASRQYTGVHIFDKERRPLGSIYVRGGQVVRAKAQDLTGIAAVRRLLPSPLDFIFLVQRYPNAAQTTENIGSIKDILERAGALPASAQAAIPAAVSADLAPTQSHRPAAPTNSWVSGAVLGAGFVLVGGIASALILRSAEPSPITTISPASTPPLAPEPALPARAEPALAQEPAANSGNANADTAAAPAATLSRAAIASFQAGLRQLGYETGPIDGVVGPRTTAAIKAFQYAEHLAVDGTLSAPARAVLARRISEP